MPEPFKNLFTVELIENLCRVIEAVYPSFNTTQFRQTIFDKHWPDKELKQRLRHITVSLHTYLPADYLKALRILNKIYARFSGFEYMFFPEYVELYGLDHYDESIAALERFTEYSTSEMAVRPYIIQYPKKMMQQMYRWSNSDNHHIRRLASEGCRPRLPWAMALPEFKKDPTPILKILENLKQDESDYVRRSVANNLNDISKDHPDLVYNIAKQWLGQNPDTDKLIKHACRTLLKQGKPKVLKLFGYKQNNQIKLTRFKLDKNVRQGQTLGFSFSLNTEQSSLGKLRIEYAIGFLRANGSLSQKVFKISEADYHEKEKSVARQHSFKQITTRQYYPGRHSLAVIVNGREMIKKHFELI